VGGTSAKGGLQQGGGTSARGIFPLTPSGKVFFFFFVRVVNKFGHDLLLDTIGIVCQYE